MTRLIRFQFGVRCTGMTGWMFSTFWVPLYGPTPKFVLSCSGTLIRLATGFCVAFCNASVELATPPRLSLDEPAWVLPLVAGVFSCAGSVEHASKAATAISSAIRSVDIDLTNQPAAVRDPATPPVAIPTQAQDRVLRAGFACAVQRASPTVRQSSRSSYG